jgi:hypothetical protein
VKVGNESPVKTRVAVVLIAVALFMLIRWFMGQNAAPAAGNQARATRPTSRVNALDPTLRTDLLKDSEQSKYENKGRNIFVAQVELPKETQKVITHDPQPPPVINTVPPIDIKFFGFANKPGEAKSIFLSRGEDIWVAKEGDVVNRRYRIIKINPNSVDVEDVLSNNRQSIPLTQS